MQNERNLSSTSNSVGDFNSSNRSSNDVDLNSVTNSKSYQISDIGSSNKSSNDTYNEETPCEFVNYIDNEIKNSMLTINEIKELIKEKMINEYCPYVIKSTKSKAATYYIYYKCAIKKCESYFRLKFVNNKLSETKSEWKHNHPMNRLFLEGNYLLISKDKKDEICGMRMNGASPGYIRKSLNLTISHTHSVCSIL